jgi:hypothetical protein
MEWMAATSDGVVPAFSAMACCAGGGIIRSSVAAADPDRAGELATDAELIARALTDDNLRAWALALTAEAVAGDDPGGAARLAADAERAAQAHNLKALPSPGSRKRWRPLTWPRRLKQSARSSRSMMAWPGCQVHFMASRRLLWRATCSRKPTYQR